MKISIVTCTWNSESYLKVAIDSVLMQEYKDYEFIFVDGGSEDETLKIIESVNVPKIIRHDIRGGIAKAMNEGIRAATGDIIIHLHSDDYLLHKKVFSHVIEVFKKTSCEWLFGRILNDRDGLLFPETYIAPQYSYKNLIKSNIVPHAATFVKKTLFDKCGYFDEHLKYAMDYEMWLRLGLHSEPEMLRDALSVFRRHDGSTTERNRLGSFDEDYGVRCRYIQHMPISRIEHLIRYHIRRLKLKRALLG
ncbi:glycosyltransferase [Aeromonas allosaccharophila]